MDSIRNAVVSICACSLVAAACSALAAEPALCGALRAHSPGVPAGEVLEEIPVDGPRWNARVPNVDLDADGASDRILLFRNGSPSKFPGDFDEAEIALSSTGATRTAVFPRIAIRRLRSQVYLVGTTYSDARPTAQLDVHLLDRRGMTKVCSLSIPVR